VEKFWTESDLIDFLFISISRKLLDLAMDDPNLFDNMLKMTLEDRAWLAFFITLYTNEKTDLDRLKKFASTLFKAERDKSCKIMGFYCKDMQFKKCSPQQQKEIEPYFKAIFIKSPDYSLLMDIGCSVVEYITASGVNLDLPDLETRGKKWFTDFRTILFKRNINVHVVIDSLDEVEAFNIMKSNCTSGSFTKVVKSFKPLLDAATTNQNLRTTLFIPHCGNRPSLQSLPDYRRDKVPLIEIKWTPNMIVRYGHFILS
jgi:hypothetical protein